MRAPRDPEEVTAQSAPAGADIDPETKLGPVHLTVSDLGRSIAYYENALGLVVRRRDDGRAVLGAGANDLLGLEELPGATSADGYSGLFHFALLVPERTDLARWLAHALQKRIPLTGLSDHAVSEAAYLRDPDHHGIEVYADRPRETWQGRVAERLTTSPLDVGNLLGELDDLESKPFDGLAAGTVMGHVHLRVSDLTRAVAFYRDVLGFALMAALGSEAAFLSAGGYHHHVGANTWESAGAPQAPPGSATLTQVTVVLPDVAERDRLAERVASSGQEPEVNGNAVLVRDPCGNRIALTAAS